MPKPAGIMQNLAVPLALAFILGGLALTWQVAGQAERGVCMEKKNEMQMGFIEKLNEVQMSFLKEQTTAQWDAIRRMRTSHPNNKKDK